MLADAPQFQDSLVVDTLHHLQGDEVDDFEVSLLPMHKLLT